MRRLSRKCFVSAMDKNNPPCYTLEPGETAQVETLDCSGGRLDRAQLRRFPDALVNPATGPIEVTGSKPGEAIAVTINQILPADWGFIGGDGDEGRFTPITIKHGIAAYPWGLELPVKPVLGVIGTAPPGDPIPTSTPSDWGGNLDTTDIRAGATVYLPVAVPGALLALGDVHALQGDGECCGTGIECEAEVALTVRRVLQPAWDRIHVVRNDSLMVFAHNESLDAAADEAVKAMSEFIARVTGRPVVYARRLLSTAGDVRISQIVNPKKTCRAIIPRAALGEAWPY
jgi:amidase